MAAEWNIAALGPEKRRLAERLLDRLRKRFAPGGLLHYGQGKWYPGEPLPRWALTCYWRTDGVPLWHDRSLLAQEGLTSDFGPLEARHFAETLARRLGLDPEYVNAAFEDPVYYLQKERQLPVNVDPVDNRLSDAARARTPPQSFRTRARYSHRLRIARPARSWFERPRMADRAVDAARPAPVPDARRFSGRPAPPAAEPAVGVAVGSSVGLSSGPDGESRAAAGSTADGS